MPTSQNPQLAAVGTILTDDLLAGIRDRAPGFDETNAFPQQDLEVLREAGYLGALAPTAAGGLGWDVSTVVAAQRVLAMHAPATALAVNMHQIWNAVAFVLGRQGDDSLGFIHRESAAGEVFAFGISEAGNDAVLFDSDTMAEPQGDGSYRFTGTKIFTTLSPVWGRLGIFGKTPDGGQLVFGFLDRSAGGWEADASSWDMLGMRATHSHTTRLQGALVPADRIVRHIPTGPNADPLTFGIFASFLTLVAAVYTGMGDRAVELATQSLARRTSKVSGRALSQDPVLRYKTGEAALRQLAVDTHLRSVAADIDAGADLGAEWFPRLVANKTMAVRTAKAQADFALEASGGASYHRGNELSRIYRDVMAGVFHPSDDESAHQTLANHLLGPVQGPEA
ncbi:acyl-CoA dehydrogenase family protein [Citricoccus sp. K5]|uniref:acyl-CoA dehydrogenase family protein n=1 Tax=Citricoccus sp. K5 TaxID=2653135 RepID=UPI0012EF924E|nr:acyl-CoA dehydrogenase family protein [Citricoccus sp. K5]VXB36718.1 Acyl-CoA dehydrogenase, short-chain specific [Citricoccus sp. K5]